MRIIETPLDGVCLLEVVRFRDERGWFSEVWNEERYREAGLPLRLAQDNVSFSHRGVLRGLHYQLPQEQAKLISVLHGTIFDVVVDLRAGSPTFAQWYGHELSAENCRQLYAAEGFAHGFLVLSESAIVHYNGSVVYSAECDHAVAWDDPDIAIAWPEPPRLMSAKDRAAPRLRDIATHELPSYALTQQ